MPQIIETIRKYNPDLVIAGPAFNAGRYGPMCGAVAKAANEAGFLSVTGMYEENPGVEMYSKYTYIVKTANSAAGMRKAVPAMAALCKKLVAGEEVSPDADGYFKRGKKNVFVDKNGAQRAFEMLMAKLKGEPVVQEIEMPPFEAVEPAAPIKDMKHAKLALVTDAGLTDKTNSFRLESSRASKYVALSIAGMDSLSADDFSANHGGYDNTQANRNPNVIGCRSFLPEGRCLCQVGRYYLFHDRQRHQPEKCPVLWRRDRQPAAGSACERRDTYIDLRNQHALRCNARKRN